MADVFISYKSEENELALRIKAVLEQNGISCWKAPESIPPGSSYPTEIMQAIRECRVAVVVLSANAQKSRHIGAEVEKAFGFNKIIIPIHIDQSSITDQFNYFLSDSQRIEAFNRTDKAFAELLSRVKTILGEPAEKKEPGPVIKTTGRIRLRVSFSCPGNGTVFFHSPDTVSKEAPAYFDITEDFFREMEEVIGGTVTAVFGADPGMVTVTPYRQPGRIACAPDDRYNYCEEPFRTDLGLNFISEHEPEGFDSFHIGISRESCEITFFRNGGYIFSEMSHDTSVSDLGIDEQELVNAMKKLVIFSNPGKTIICQNSLKAKVYPDNSGAYHLYYITK